ncbi:hypothetical protein LINPERHAP1_LOCUS21014 [Linum perenne]
MQEDEVDNLRCPKIAFSDVEIKSFYKLWSKAIIVKVLKKSFSYLSIKKILEFLWAKAGRIQVADLANSFFLVRFSSEEDYQRASFGGPWKVAVTRIGNYIGKTILLDLATSAGARARYARVCIEVDLTKPLLGKYIIDNRVYRVEYESLENICFSYGVYGHKGDRCPAKEDVTPVGSTDVAPPEKVTAPEGDVGCWMMVSRRNKKREPGLKTSKYSEKGY